MTETTYPLDHDALRAAMAAKRWSPEQLAAASRVDRRTVRRVLDPAAPRKVVRASTAQIIARALGVRPGEIAEGAPEAEHRPRPRYNGPRLKWNADRPEDKSRSARRRYVRQQPVEDGEAA